MAVPRPTVRCSQSENSQGAASSIIGILEVVENGSSKNLTEAEAEYQKLTQQNKVTLTSLEQDASEESNVLKRKLDG